MRNAFTMAAMLSLSRAPQSFAPIHTSFFVSAVLLANFSRVSKVLPDKGTTWDVTAELNIRNNAQKLYPQKDSAQMLVETKKKAYHAQGNKSVGARRRPKDARVARAFNSQNQILYFSSYRYKSDKNGFLAFSRVKRHKIPCKSNYL